MTAPTAPTLRARLKFDARPSIRRSLVMWLVLPLALLVPATAFVFYRLALAPALDSLDHALDGTALALERLVREDDGKLTLVVSKELDSALRADRYDEVHWVALGPDGRVLGGDAELAALGGPPSPVDWRFFDAVYNQQPVRVALHSWTCMPAAPGREAAQCEARVSETLNKRHGVAQQVLAAAASAMVDRKSVV